MSFNEALYFIFLSFAFLSGYKVKLAFHLPFYVTFPTAHSRYTGSPCVESVSMHTDVYYYGRFVFFSFIILQALKSGVHSSFLNLHDYLQSYFFFFMKIYFQIVEHWLITKLLALYKSPRPITGDVAFKAGFSLGTGQAANRMLCEAMLESSQGEAQLAVLTPESAF